MYAVIIAGGKGERFWPRSRRSRPKQFLKMIGNVSMLRATYERVTKIVPPGNIIVVTSRELKKGVYDELPEINRKNVLVEPKGRNTAPAIGLAALYISDIDPDATMAVFPSDHLIKNPRRFIAAVNRARGAAEMTEGLVTIGITPSRPETGYGYIQVSEADVENGFYKVKTFAEKPNLGTAKRFLRSGDFFWNSGIFVWKASAIQREMEVAVPELHSLLMKLKNRFGQPDFSKKLTRIYSQIRGTSIDYAVMEVSKNVYMVRGDFAWNDLGSWESLYNEKRKDSSVNVIEGNAVLLDSKECLVISNDKLIAGIGLDDMVVISTDDVVFISPKGRVQEVRALVDKLKKGGKKKYL